MFEMLLFYTTRGRANIQLFKKIYKFWLQMLNEGGKKLVSCPQYFTLGAIYRISLLDVVVHQNKRAQARPQLPPV